MCNQLLLSDQMTPTWGQHVLKQVDAAHLAGERADRRAEAGLMGREPGGDAARVQLLPDLHHRRLNLSFIFILFYFFFICSLSDLIFFFLFT